jgi:hypothetical protein
LTPTPPCSPATRTAAAGKARPAADSRRSSRPKDEAT